MKIRLIKTNDGYYAYESEDIIIPGKWNRISYLKYSNEKAARNGLIDTMQFIRAADVSEVIDIVDI